MNSLIAAAAAFVGIHLLISGTPLRGALVARLGERPYLGLFTVLSFATLGWLIYAFVQVHVPTPTALMPWRWIAWVLNFFAIVFIVYGAVTPSPTAVAGQALLKREATGMQRITRHPMLYGIALLSGVHFVFNPEPPTRWLFGTFVVLGLFGPWSIDAKLAIRYGDNWRRYCEKTSNLPFVAILQRRNQLVLGELLDWRLAASVAIYFAFLFLHPRFFGMPAF